MIMQKSLSGLWRKRRHQQLCLCRRLHEEESWLDPEISQLTECIKTGEWGNALPQYKAVRNDIFILGKLVLRGTRLLIPAKLSGRVVGLAHEGHQGLTKTNHRLRSKVWWAGIDRQVEAKC